MPYVSTHEGRYIGEHSCNIHHNGDQTLIRQCCIDDCTEWAHNLVRVALTTSHPAYRIYMDSWNALTDAERAHVPNVRYRGMFDGFEIPTA